MSREFSRICLALGIVSFLGGMLNFTCPSTTAPKSPLIQRRAVNGGGDLVRDAVATAAYELWAAEYPQAVVDGHFFGQPMSLESVAERVSALKLGLQIDWAQVLGLVKADSVVLFAGSEEQIGEAFTQLTDEFGSRDVALEVVSQHPVILLAKTLDIKGKGDLLRVFVQLADTLRPIDRALRSAAWSADGLPKPLGWAALGLS